MQSIKKQSGFGLVEVLITAVILAIGLLGVASLQSRSTQAAQEGDNLASASLIAYEMAQRMMTNQYITARGRSGYLALDLSGEIAAAGGIGPWITSTESIPSIFYCYPNSISNTCASGATETVGLERMMLLDQLEMRKLAQQLLPDGEIMICFDTQTTEATLTANFTCNNTATRVTAREENIFTIKVRWTNIFSNTTKIYANQFNAECTNTTPTTGCL